MPLHVLILRPPPQTLKCAKSTRFSENGGKEEHSQTQKLHHPFNPSHGVVTPTS